MIYVGRAKIARVPMVITAGQQDLRHIPADPLLAANLVQIAAPAAKWCFEPNSLDDLPLILRRAFNSSVTPPRGPVFLSLPMNILDELARPRRRSGMRPPPRYSKVEDLGVETIFSNIVCVSGVLFSGVVVVSHEFYQAFLSEDANGSTRRWASILRFGFWTGIGCWGGTSGGASFTVA